MQPAALDPDASEAARRRWQEADNRRERVQAELDRLDAMERAGLDVKDPDRADISAALADLDDDVQAAEVAFHRSVDDDHHADQLVTDGLERDLISSEENLHGGGDES